MLADTTTYPGFVGVKTPLGKKYYIKINAIDTVREGPRAGHWFELGLSGGKSVKVEGLLDTFMEAVFSSSEIDDQ